jgi:hypothetical protein
MKIIGRNSFYFALGHINQTDVVGTPEGFKWLYEFFIKKLQKKQLLKLRPTTILFACWLYRNTKRNVHTAQVDAYLN